MKEHRKDLFTPEERKRRKIERLRWGRFTRALRDKRGNKCQACGIPEDNSKPQGFLHCHHIKRQKSFPELKFDESNILVLCNDCHNKFEGITDAELLEKLLA